MSISVVLQRLRTSVSVKTIQITFSEHAHVRLYQRATGTSACLLNGHSGLFEWSCG